MNEKTAGTARWIIGICVGILITVSGWSFAAAETVRNREIVKGLDRLDRAEFLLQSHEAELAMVRERLYEFRDTLMENNRLLLQMAKQIGEWK